jgi:hypothetical protein
MRRDKPGGSWPFPRTNVNSFLAEHTVAALSVSAGDKRGPLDGADLVTSTGPAASRGFITGAGSRKHRLIDVPGRNSR